MSTKIYDGYKLEIVSNDLYELKNIFKPIYDGVKKHLEDIFISQTAELLLHILNNNKIYDEEQANIENNELLMLYYNFNLTKGRTYNYLFLLRELIDKDEKSRLRKDTLFSFRTKFIFYPLKDKLLLRVVTDKSGILSLLGYIGEESIEKGKYDLVSEYEYWNSTDKPSFIDEEEWEQRRQDWNEIDEEMVFKLEINILSDFTKLIKPDAILAYMNKNYDERISAIAERQVMKEFFESLSENIEFKHSTFNKIRKDFENSEDYKNKINKKVTQLKEIIPKEYTKNDIYNIKITGL